ncbi:MAG: excinuclease ABC subunit UvrC [Candidatus Omnitrophica bacterium]|nr:excinuclease ABC subunit UvrC [Candidatus Omnitrophota bacterium]
MDLQEKVKSFPEAPGVYLMKGKGGEILYVGKAASLRKRVLSYFQVSRSHPSKIALLLEQVREVDTLVTRSEAEALFYEASLIKTHRPKYNVALRDDKTYPWVKLTHEEFPRIFITRRKAEDGSLYFGPYTDAKLLRSALASMRRNFPLRNCRKFPKKPCLDYYIGQCLAPCVGYIDRVAYGNIVEEAKLFLEGKRQELLRSLSQKMQEFSHEKRFEEAAKVRDEIEALSGVASRDQRSGWLEQLSELREVLRLEAIPHRIEAFDISNIFGTSACGSMVSFVDGIPYKDGYRRFRIKEVRGIDDYQMMREVVRRRYRRVKREHLEAPDLLLIDGGRGHLSAASGVLRELGLGKLAMVGIAKRHEWIYQMGRSDPIILPKTSKALHLIQRIRDEAHRFAIGYHHLLRERSQEESILTEIPGLGPRKRQELLCHFKSLEELKKTSRQKLMEVRGITEKLAERIEETLQGR